MLSPSMGKILVSSAADCSAADVVDLGVGEGWNFFQIKTTRLKTLCSRFEFFERWVGVRTPSLPDSQSTAAAAGFRPDCCCPKFCFFFLFGSFPLFPLFRYLFSHHLFEFLYLFICMLFRLRICWSLWKEWVVKSDTKKSKRREQRGKGKEGKGRKKLLVNQRRRRLVDSAGRRYTIISNLDAFFSRRLMVVDCCGGGRLVGGDKMVTTTVDGRRAVTATV